MTNKLKNLFTSFGWEVDESGSNLVLAKKLPSGKRFKFELEPYWDIEIVPALEKFTEEFDAEVYVNDEIEKCHDKGIVCSIRELLTEGDHIKALLSALLITIKEQIIFKPYTGRPKTFKEIQESIDDRKLDPDFDYYDNDNICILHIKFGHIRKCYTGLKVENGIPQEFIDEYQKYWVGDPSMFDDHYKIVDYIVEHDLPVILYFNFTDEEGSLAEVKEYFKK